MTRTAAPQAPGDGPAIREDAPQAPNGTDYPRGPAPQAPGGSEDHAVEVDACISTSSPGELFLVRVNVYNTGGVETEIPVVLVRPVALEDFYWNLEKSHVNVESALEGTGLFGVGSINDTLTLPYGRSASYVLGFRSKINTPIGTTYTITATVDGVPYSTTVQVLKDQFFDTRNQADLEAIIPGLFGIHDSNSICQAREIQDHINKGLRFGHLFEDLAARRGYPVKVSACGCTVLSAGTLDGTVPCPVRVFSSATIEGWTMTVVEDEIGL